MMTSDIFSHVFNGYKVLILVYRNFIACQTNHNVLYCVAWCFGKFCVFPINPFFCLSYLKQNKNWKNMLWKCIMSAKCKNANNIFIHYELLICRKRSDFLVFILTATFPRANHSQRTFHTALFIAERQTGKPWILIFWVISLTRPRIETEFNVLQPTSNALIGIGGSLCATFGFFDVWNKYSAFV